jgi:hypothetical protein
VWRDSVVGKKSVCYTESVHGDGPLTGLEMSFRSPLVVRSPGLLIASIP